MYHHWSMKHCGRHIDEFTFRMNEDNCVIDTMDRIDALISGCAGKRLTYVGLTKGG